MATVYTACALACTYLHARAHTHTHTHTHTQDVASGAPKRPRVSFAEPDSGSDGEGAKAKEQVPKKSKIERIAEAQVRRRGSQPVGMCY